MSVAVFNPNIYPAAIDKFRLVVPPNTANFVTLNPSGAGKVRLRLISASNLIAADANGYSDPYIKVKATSIGSTKVTKTIQKNLNPIWNEETILDIAGVQRELLIIDVYDEDKVGNDDLLGYVGIDLSVLPLGYEVITNEPLSFAKHGTVQIGITALDFGVTNLPVNYLDMYTTWRNTLPAYQRKEFKSLKKAKHQGPYIGKTIHSDYKLVCGCLKRKKNKREKTAKGIGKVLKKVGKKILEEALDGDGGDGDGGISISIGDD